MINIIPRGILLRDSLFGGSVLGEELNADPHQGRGGWARGGPYFRLLSIATEGRCFCG